MDHNVQRILLVNEPPDGRAGEFLSGEEFVVVPAEGDEQVAAALAEAPAALCVLWAGGTGALELCERIRSGPRGAVVPLLVIGGPGTAVESRLQALEAGADSFLERGEVEHHLSGKVRTLLGLDERTPRDPLEQALAAAEAVVPAARDNEPVRIEEAGIAVGSVSVLEVIDQVEQRLDDEPAAEQSPTREPSRDRLWIALAIALAERRGGALVIRRGGTERRLFLEQGEVVMAVSSAREDRLVELLYREGRLTEEQYRQAVMTVGASGRRVGAVLVERGLIASRELFPLVRHHYETLVIDSFAWKNCEWHFEDGARQPGERILLDVPTAALIVEGIRSRAGRDDVDALVPPGSKPCLQERGIAALEDVGLPAEEQQLLDLCDGSLSTTRIAKRSGLPEDELRALLAGLAVLGWVRAEGGGDQAETGADPPPQSQAGIEAALRVERARVGEKLAAAEESSYFAVLEIAPEASGHEIRRSYRRLRAQFAAERFAVEELADLRGPAEVVRIVLDESYEILRDPAMRETYRKARHGTEAGSAGEG
jgi:CheY-like chemotaxis protein